jgi:hypothetical protein
MPIDQILPLLIAERDKLNRAIEALQGPTKRPGRPPKKTIGIETSAAAPKKRQVSAAARRRMAEGQRKRWAAIKASK